MRPSNNSQSQNNFSSEFQKILDDVTNNRVTEVNLIKKEIGAKGAIALAEALKVNNTVKKVYLWNNEIGDEGAIALAEAIKVNRTLIKIDFSYNSIGHAGATALAEAIKVNQTLINLGLEGNGIGAEGATALAEAIKVNQTVNKVNLSYNSIGSEGAKKFAEALKVNQTIKVVDFRANQIRSEGPEAIAEALEVNQTVIYFYLKGNLIADSTLSSIETSIKRNQELSKQKKSQQNQNPTPAPSDVSKAQPSNQPNLIEETRPDQTVNQSPSKQDQKTFNKLRILKDSPNNFDNYNSQTALDRESVLEEINKIPELQSALKQLQEELKEITSLKSENPRIKAASEKELKEVQERISAAEAELSAVDTKYKLSPEDNLEIAHIAANPALSQYYQTTQKSLNELLDAAKIVSTDEFKLKSSNTSRALNALSTTAGPLPFASTILSATAGISDIANESQKRGEFANISDLNPTSSPIDQGILAEKIARRMAITNQEEIKGNSRANNSEKIGFIQNFVDATKASLKKQTNKISPTTSRGFFGEDFTPAQLLAMSDCKSVIGYVINQNPNEVIQTKREAVQENKEVLVNRIVRNGLKKEPVRLSASNQVKQITAAPSSKISPIAKASSNLVSRDFVDKKTFEKALKENAKLHERIVKAEADSKLAHQKAAAAEDVVNSVFQSHLSEKGGKVIKSVKTKEGATIKVINSEADEKFSSLAQENEATKEELREMKEKMSHLEKELQRRKKPLNKKGCVIS